jgi:hypothetical protein
MQRDELRLQREALVRSQQELKRSAEADLRALHLDLIRMAIENSDLVVAWPELDANLPPERAQQYLYANLILQHYRMQLIVGDRSLEQVRAYVRFSFQSPIVRAYWAASEQARRAVNPAGTSTSEFDQLCDEVYREGPAAEDAP